MVDLPEIRRTLAVSQVSRAIGLAESLEHPIVPLDNGTRAVASEIVILLRSVRDALLAAGGEP